jgi:hypothetical protein
MQEHALPQDVTGYKFHIIGNMTLKQFGEVAAGCIVGFLLYQTNLLPIIKFPLIVMAAGAGAMVAFVPIEERPLDQWITAFFSALYRPTQYYWKRMVKIPEPFLYEPKGELRTVVEDVDLTPARRQRVKDYLRSIDEKPSTVDQFDQYTSQRLDQVMNEFGSVTQPSLGTTEDALPVTTAADEEALLHANPDTVSSTVDSLSFAARGVVDDVVVQEEGPSQQEMEMSNSVLRLFETTETLGDSLPQPTLPTSPPEASESPKPITPPEPEKITSSAPVVQPEQIEPVLPPPQSPTPEPEPKPEPIPEPEPKPIVVPPAAEEKKPVTIVKPAETSYVPPPAPKEVPKEVPQDLTELPDVSLTPEASETPAQTEVPQISTVFDPAAAAGESIPKVQTVDKYSLSAHPNADSSQIAEVADVIAAVGQRPKGKNKVQFKTARTAENDKFETVLPHILDMTGTAPTVKVEQTPPPAPEHQVQQNKEVLVPELEDIRVEHTVKAPDDQTQSAGSETMSSAVDPSLLQPAEKQSPVQASGAVTFNADLPFPEKPTQPNKVVGMVIDKDGMAQPNAIVEILSPEGIPARAVKTNPLGQFFIATPLNPGEYLITAEKEGFQFSTQQLSVTNKIIDPIEIRAN